MKCNHEKIKLLYIKKKDILPGCFTAFARHFTAFARHFPHATPPAVSILNRNPPGYI